MPIDQSVPILFKVTVPKHGFMLDLCKALASMVEGLNGDNLIVTDVYNHKFHKIFSQDEGNLLKGIGNTTVRRKEISNVTLRT